MRIKSLKGFLCLFKCVMQSVFYATHFFNPILHNEISCSAFEIDFIFLFIVNSFHHFTQLSLLRLVSFCLWPWHSRRFTHLISLHPFGSSVFFETVLYLSSQRNAGRGAVSMETRFRRRQYSCCAVVSASQTAFLWDTEVCSILWTCVPTISRTASVRK